MSFLGQKSRFTSEKGGGRPSGHPRAPKRFGGSNLYQGNHDIVARKPLITSEGQPGNCNQKITTQGWRRSGASSPPACRTARTTDAT